MREPITILCEGTRIAADLWLPEELRSGDRIPAILLCHGWGGLKDHLNSTYARWFAKAGFAVLAFDYRGFGESGSRPVPLEEPRNTDAKGEVLLRALLVREVVDPFDQIQDIRACLDYLEGRPEVDPARIGLWGTSYGGGHVAFMAACDPRVKAIVAQVGAQGPAPALVAAGVGRERAIARARGEIGPLPPAEDAVPGLSGTPDLAKMIRYRPLATAELIRVPTLVIDAEHEELFDRLQNGRALHEIVRRNAPSRYVLFPCKHYEIYDRFYRDASSCARDWFVEHLEPRRAG